MARPRSFDEDAVLTAAMHAFRREGYARMSVTRLEQATGLRTSSLYNSYGDKAGLFERALDHYITSFMEPRLAAYAGPDATLEDLERLFLSVLEPPLNDGFGCLVVNSAVEFGDGPAAARVTKALQAVADHIDSVLSREVGDASDAAALALLYQGLLVQSRAGTTTDRHGAAVTRQFARIRALREESR